VYYFTRAFGIAEDPGCAIPYYQVLDTTYWSGDTREGMHYNEMVDIRDCPNLNKAASERIIDNKYEYRYCLNISFNAEGTPGRGSAIFLHCAGPGKYSTAGCVSIPENEMRQVMELVRPDCIIIIDTAETLASYAPADGG
jgi:L,D-peptidoglycan transpeptidase YkuD (ErfK/YbiS/YcfS/YnhG family)